MVYKLIGSGSYGCVVQPPYNKNVLKQYKEYKAQDVVKSDIGKLFKSSMDDIEFRKEYEQYTRLEQIPKFDDLSVKMKGANRVLLKDINEEIEECVNENYTQNEIKVDQIIYEYGGRSIKDLTSKIQYKVVIKMFYDLLDAFEPFSMEKRRLHTDISYGNILINDKKLSIIDFGFEQSQEGFFINDRNKSFFKHLYIFYPPEYKISYGLMTNPDRNIDDLLKIGLTNYNDVIKRYPRFKDVFTEKQIMRQMKSALAPSQKDKSIATVQRKDFKPELIDIYSICMVIFTMIDNIDFDNLEEYKKLLEILRLGLNHDYKARCNVTMIKRKLGKITNVEKQIGGYNLKLRFKRRKKPQRPIVTSN